MPEEYVREQLWKLYGKLPEELKEAIFSVGTADIIGNTCERHKVPEEKVSEVAKYTGRVLMGLLPPNEFEGALEKEVKLKKDSAKNVSREISRLVFFPLKEVLSQLYEIEIVPVAGAEGKKTEIPLPKPSPERPSEESLSSPPRPERPRESDTYRETVE